MPVPPGKTFEIDPGPAPTKDQWAAFDAETRCSDPAMQTLQEGKSGKIVRVLIRIETTNACVAAEAAQHVADAAGFTVVGPTRWPRSVPL